MIVLLFLLLAALAIGGLLAASMLRDPGYVLVAYDGATLESSLWFALAALLTLWLAGYGISFLIRRSWRGGAWLRKRRATSARNRLLQGLMLLAEGRWRDAEPALLASAGRTDVPLAGFLGAARAANEQGRYEVRDAALEQARKATPEAAFAIELVRTQLQQAAGQWQPSATTLNALRTQAPRHPLVLKQLFEAYKALADWDAVAELAPSLPKDAGADMEAVQTVIWRTRLAKPRDSADAAEHARNVWKAMPRKLRSDETLLLDYIDVLVAHDAGTQAEAVLRQGLKNHWRDAWVRRYGTIPAAAAKRLHTALGWLKSRPDDATLLLTLGRLARDSGDMEQARGYLEAGWNARPDVETASELARAYSAGGDHATANDYLRQALELRAADGRFGDDAKDVAELGASNS